MPPKITVSNATIQSKGNDSSTLSKGNGLKRFAAARFFPTDLYDHKSDGRQNVGSKNKAELLDKRHNLRLGAKLQPIWESRSLKINPILNDDLNRFFSNAQHTQRFAWLNQSLFLLWNNLKSVPYFWSLLIVIVEIVAPYILANGSPKLSWYGTGSIAFVSLFISLFTGILEAGKRYVIGRFIDEKHCFVLEGRKARIKPIRISELVVGNIVKLTHDEEVPADIVALACSNPDGHIHIDTSSLDGTNYLKVKHCVKDTRIESSIHSFANLRGQIVCDKPSPNMDSFSGTLKLKGHPRPSTVQLSNFIMKGSIIRNVSTVYGVVTHTGPDTKIAQNVKNLNKPIKFGTLDRDVNNFCMILFCIYLPCLFISIGTRWSSIINERAENKESTTMDKLTLTILPSDSLLFVAIRFIALYGGLIPATLPAVVNFLRFIYTALYDGDYTQDSVCEFESRSSLLGIPSPKTVSSSHPVSWSLNSGLYEELGMVDFVFTDKTGTLTTKNLSISLLTVGSKSYRCEDMNQLRNEIEKDLPDNERLDIFLKMMCFCNACIPVYNASHLDTMGSTRISTGAYKHSGSGCSDLSYLTQNTCTMFKHSKSKIQFGSVSYIGPNGENDENSGSMPLENAMDEDDFPVEMIQPRSCRLFSSNIQFNSTSREDECMCEIANELGYRLLSKTSTEVQFEARKINETWSIVGINKFTSTRGMMSAVLKQSPQREESIVFAKGCGEVMLELISEGEKEIENLRNRLRRLAHAGYRTFVCGYRYLDSQQTQLYKRHYVDAEESIYTQEERYASAAHLVENNLNYLGCVAFMDEIQDGVSETLDLLMDSGVRVWMTTGDSRDLAIQTAYSSKLIVQPCSVFDAKLPLNEPPDGAIKYANTLYELFLQERASRVSGEQLCLVVDGQDIKLFLSNNHLQTCLINMACFSDVVVACRLSPCQKADLVSIVKSRLLPTPITLAIGDGMNDIKMIQEAHIGVGVISTESPHAAAYADFAVTKFAALRNLLFLQGNRSLQSFSTLLYWSFFKCLCLTMPIFYYQGGTDWLGLDLYGSYILILFHLFFTTVPLIFCTLFEKQLPDSALTGIPLLYTLSRRRYNVNLLRLCFWILEGIITSTFCYFSLRTSVESSPIFYGGGTISARAFGLLNSLAALVMSNVRLLIESGFKNRFVLMIMSISFVVVFPSLFLLMTYTFGGAALSNATRQIIVWHPLYFLLPLWATAAILSFSISSIVQTMLSPNLLNCLKQWLAKQRCTCDTNVYELSLKKGVKPERINSKTNEMMQQSVTKRMYMESSACNVTNELKLQKSVSVDGFKSTRNSDLFQKKKVPAWQRLCPCILERARGEFNVHGMEWVAKMIPVSRPFRVNDIDNVNNQESSRSKDVQVSNNTQQVQTAPNQQNVKKKVGTMLDCEETEDCATEGSSAIPINQRVDSLIDPITLRFKDMQLEADYLLDKRKNHYYTNCGWYRTVFISLGAFYFANWLLEYFIRNALGQGLDWRSVVPSMFVVFVAIVCTINTLNLTGFVKYIDVALGSLVFSMVLQHMFNKAITDPVSWLQPVLFPIVTFVILHISFIYALLCNVIFMAVSMNNIGSSWHCIPLFIGINVFAAFVGYRLEYNNRKSFLLEFSVANARKKQSELLNTMLPNFVVSKMINARLNEDGIPIGFEAEENDCVSVVFCDIYNFQEMVATIEPTRLVELLDSLFLAFDRCAEQFGATKIETVSETYLSALGLSRGTEQCPYEAAANAIDMALAMLEVASQIRYPCKKGGVEVLEPLPVKIGINSGRVISGLVGSKKPQYALFGDTVNTASRMKATGEAGHIHVSDRTHELIKSDTTLNFTQLETFVKGKGKMSTFLLTSVVGSCYPNFDTNSQDQQHSIEKDYPTTTRRYIDNFMRCSTKFVPESSVDTTAFTPAGAGSNAATDVSVNLPTNAIIRRHGHQSTQKQHDIPLLFESLDKSHVLNRNAGENISARTDSSTSSVVALYATDFERIRIRKLRISAAIGAHIPEDDVLIREHPVFVRGFTSYGLARTDTTPVMGSKSHSTTSMKCFSFCRKRALPNIRHSFSMSSISVVSNGALTKPGKCKSGAGYEDKSPKNDHGDVRMKTTERLFLRFSDRLQEDRYRLHFYNNEENSHTVEHALVIFLVTFVAQSIVAISLPRVFTDSTKVEQSLQLNFIPYWTVRSVYIILAFILWFLFHYTTDSSRTESSGTCWMRFFLNLFFVSAACVFALSNSWAVSRSQVQSVTLNLWLPSDSVEFYFYIIVLHHNSAMLFQTCVLVDMLFMIMSMTFISSSVIQTTTTHITLFSIPCFILFNLLSAHCREAIDRRTFYANKKAKMIEARVGQMLNEMLPKSVLEEFQADRLKMSYCHDKMAILFSDIVGFTSWANSVDASEVIALLQKLFARFDRNSTKFGLYKLCTIGDAYVAVSEPATEVTTDAVAIRNIESILQMAHSMLNTIQEIREKFGIPGLNMRIGLHYGSSVGGVVGSGRLRYDLWGIDMHTANLMESNGAPGRVCVSQCLKDILTSHFPNRFSFEFHAKVQVVNHFVDCWLLTNDSNDT